MRLRLSGRFGPFVHRQALLLALRDGRVDRSCVQRHDRSMRTYRRQPGHHTVLVGILAILVVLVAGAPGGDIDTAAQAADSGHRPSAALIRARRHARWERRMGIRHRKGRGRRSARFLAATSRSARRLSQLAAGPLTFGIYPGGAAGTVGPSGVTKPESSDLRMAALLELRGSAPRFTVHLYDTYTGAADAAAIPSWLAGQISSYAAQGMQIELVLAYRPARAGGDVGGFVDFVSARVRQLGPGSGVTGLQVTNEVNVTGAPNAADGAYPGALEALVLGVTAARDQAKRDGNAGLRVGFNWAYQKGPAETDLFRRLRAIGGRRFAAAVDWVGIDAYPGTWGPTLSGDLASGSARATVDAMRTLRRELMPLAGLDKAAIHFSEAGYPTGPGRSDQMQQTVMRAVIGAVLANRRVYGVTDLRWFDLRDADSSSTSFESQYGLTRDDYSPKPAFFTYRDLIAANSR